MQSLLMVLFMLHARMHTVHYLLFFPANPDRQADAKPLRLISQKLRPFWQLPHNFAVNIQFQHWQTWKHGLVLQAM